MTYKKTASRSVALPTLQQAMHMVCAAVAESLSTVIELACSTEQWRDDYQDGLHTVEVALDIVERLKAEMPSDTDTFNLHWWRATSVARLGRDSFTSLNAPASLALQTVVDDFEAMHRVVSFLDSTAEQGREAA